MGWTAEGQFKIFDFGLCTCVRKGETQDEAYELTGCTGSMRYMAPEVCNEVREHDLFFLIRKWRVQVALRKPYNHSVDVYSFGIIVWEIATGRIAFDGVTKYTFLEGKAYACLSLF